MQSEVPWKHCNHSWNTPNCTSFADRIELIEAAANNTGNMSRTINLNHYKLANEEFFENAVLGLDKASGLEHVGPVKWEIAMCLLLLYYCLLCLAVWVTATMPYVVLLILLVRGCTLEGASRGIYYYLNPQFDRMLDIGVWVDAAAQIFFSLGPGFGVLLALASYNKSDNNCYRDAIITSAINFGTSILAGFVVFSVLGHMAFKQNMDVKDVARNDVGLIFIVYPEAISNLYLSPLWAVIFFFMLITLGLDTTFGGLEAIATGLLDEFPSLRKRRELFTLGLMIYCFWGALATTTHGGIYVVQLMDTYGAPISLIFVVFLEATAISWIYGVERFSHDIQSMLGFYPGLFWRICWKYISPIFLLSLFILSIINPAKPEYGGYKYPDWAISIGWCMVFSSLLCIPSYIIYKFIKTPGGVKEKLRSLITPEETPIYGQEVVPVYI
ncbi:hypothetical protein ACJMK2_011422 [Sinanodonta woodiana]|uniref:Uncharacterized protein n=1 Tax=Sinanodonta woodiana TaxID=1069815 RepID=A0ABD3V7E5_SINWO